MLNLLRQTIVLILVVAGGIYCVPDPASLKTALFAVAVVCIITGLIVLIIGIKDRWGVLPEINFTRTIDDALRTPQSSAEVLKGFLIFLGLVLLAVMKAQ